MESDYVTFMGEMEIQVLQSFSYFHYPFDVQTIVMRLEVPGAELVNCNGGYDVLSGMELTEDNKDEKLLPATEEWLLQGSLNESVSFSHENDDQSTCVMRIRVRRNPVVFFFKVRLPRLQA